MSAALRLRDHRVRTFDSSLLLALQDWIGSVYQAAGFASRTHAELTATPTFTFEQRDSGRPVCGMVGRSGRADALCLPVRAPRAQVQGLLGLFDDLARGLGLEVARVEISGAPELAGLADTSAHGADARLDLHVLDSLGRAWCVGWIEAVDGAPPFGASSLANATHLRASLLGPLPDLLAMLYEHGPLPLWLAPEQVRVLVVSEKHLPWAVTVWRRLRVAGLRVQPPAAHSSGPLAGRVRSAEEARVPRVLVIGAREAQARAVALRGEPESIDMNVCARRLEREARVPETSPNLQWVVSCAAQPAVRHTR